MRAARRENLCPLDVSSRLKRCSRTTRQWLCRSSQASLFLLPDKRNCWAQGHELSGDKSGRAEGNPGGGQASSTSWEEWEQREGGLLEQEGAHKAAQPGEAAGGAKPSQEPTGKGASPSELPHSHSSPPPPAPSPRPAPAARAPAPLQPLLPACSSLVPPTTNPLPQPARAGRHIPGCRLLFAQRPVLFPGLCRKGGSVGLGQSLFCPPVAPPGLTPAKDSVPG